MYYSKQEQINYQIDKLKYHFKRLNHLGALDYAIEKLRLEGIDLSKAEPFFNELKATKKKQPTKGRFENLEIDEDDKWASKKKAPPRRGA